MFEIGGCPDPLRQPPPGMSKLTSREEALFAEALSRPEEQRSSFLADICAREPAMGARVAALLTAHASPDELAPPASAFHVLQRPGETSGGRIGRAPPSFDVDETKPAD